jgi:hypothetical protein
MLDNQALLNLCVIIKPPACTGTPYYLERNKVKSQFNHCPVFFTLFKCVRYRTNNPIPLMDFLPLGSGMLFSVNLQASSCSFQVWFMGVFICEELLEDLLGE